MEDLFNLKHIHSFLKGVNRFYNHFERRKAANQIIWQEGSTQFIDYTIKCDETLPTLIFIPSLINKSYILDLAKDMSMVKYFAERGFRVILVDFNEPLNSEYQYGFLEYQQRLKRGLESLKNFSPFITIGYCLGGLFSCLLSSEPDLNIKAQVLLATPFDFSHFANIMGLNNKLIMEELKKIIKTMGKIPPSLVQWFFSALDPEKIWNKYVDFSAKEEGTAKFIAVEQWINDGISLSQKFALECLTTIENNKLPFTIESTIPSLILNGEDDKIVPPLLADKAKLWVKDNELYKTGHIGLIVGRFAHQQIWPRIYSFTIDASKEIF